MSIERRDYDTARSNLATTFETMLRTVSWPNRDINQQMQKCWQDVDEFAVPARIEPKIGIWLPSEVVERTKVYYSDSNEEIDDFVFPGSFFLTKPPFRHYSTLRLPEVMKKPNDKDGYSITIDLKSPYGGVSSFLPRPFYWSILLTHQKSGDDNEPT